MDPVGLDALIEGLDVRAYVGPEAYPIVTGVCIDSRKVRRGDLFFALKGERSDGHLYVDQALAAGAAAVVISELDTFSLNSQGGAGPYLLVEDTLRFLGQTSRNYRRRFRIPVIAITGSVGKTSVKEMTAAVLRSRLNTHANEKNYNNEIGVPLTLFGLNHTHEAAILEMGMRAAGEIDWLAEVAEPTIGLITNIGHAHLERLGSRQGIADAKAELLRRLPADGVAILPRHDPYYEFLRACVPPSVRVITFTDAAGVPADVSVHAEGDQYSASAAGRRLDGTLSAAGEHHYRNAAAALAIAQAVGVPLEAAIEALSQWTGAAGRLAIRTSADGLTVIDDCYNAGPESMASALDTLAKLANGRGVAVLGDMRELGPEAPDLHRQVGRAAAAARPRRLITVGDLATHIAEGAAGSAVGNGGGQTDGREPLETAHYSDAAGAAAHIREHVRPGDTVLVKGSRAMEMEQIVAALLGEAGGQPRG